ncbi:hypothetical protein ES702_03121 [subsurface metagenome]
MILQNRTSLQTSISRYLSDVVILASCADVGRGRSAKDPDVEKE